MFKIGRATFCDSCGNIRLTKVLNQGKTNHHEMLLGRFDRHSIIHQEPSEFPYTCLDCKKVVTDPNAPAPVVAPVVTKVSVKTPEPVIHLAPEDEIKE